MADVSPGSPTKVRGNLERVVVGALGGLCAVIVKYLSQDNQTFVDFLNAYSMDAAPFSGFVPYIVEYSIITPILLFLGGVVGWISGESVRIKLFALGVSAPALITTWSPASPLGKVGSAEDILVPSAYAASVSAVSGYLVQIGAFSARDLALRLASGINAKVGSARAFVTEDPADRVTPFRVRVLSNMSFSAALALRQDLLKTGLIKDAIVVDLSRDQH